MFTYAKVKDQPALLRTMTSLDRSEVEELVEPFRAAWAARVRQTAHRQQLAGATDEDRVSHERRRGPSPMGAH